LSILGFELDESGGEILHYFYSAWMGYDIAHEKTVIYIKLSLEEESTSKNVRDITVLTCPSGADDKEAVVEGIPFPFNGQGETNAPFDKVGSSAVAGVCLLELVFAFFRGGGSISPSSLYEHIFGYVSNMDKRISVKFKNKRAGEKHLRFEEQLILVGKAARWPLRWLSSRRLQSCTNKENMINILVTRTRLRCVG
jgi:hypothetical protein